jgi:hypothetical protein
MYKIWDLDDQLLESMNLAGRDRWHLKSKREERWEINKEKKPESFKGREKS